MEVRGVVLVLFLIHVVVHAAHAATTSVPPSITRGSKKKIYFTKGRKVRLTCPTGGSPTPLVFWLKDRERINYDSTDNRDRVIKDADNSLLIEDARETDAGFYQCRAENLLGISLSDKVQVAEVVAAGSETPTTRVRRPMLGHSLKLNCNAPRSQSENTIMWSYHYDYDYEENQDYVQLSERITMDYDGNLYFVSVVEDDVPGDGDFVCGIYNKFTRAVQYGNAFKITPRGRSPVKQPLKLLWSTPTTELGMKGKTLKMKCIFGGNPLPEVSWSRIDGSALDLNRIKFGDGKYEMQIQDLREADAGVYMCTGRGGGNKVITRTYTVDIEASPTWVTEPRDVTADVGGDVEIDCRGEGTPSPRVEWLINGIPLKETVPSKNRIVTEGKLVLTGLKKSDAMVIQCNISNRHGYLWSDTYLNVIADPATIEKTESSDIKVVRAGSGLLPCVFTGQPTPKLTWFKGDQKIQRGGRYKVLENGSLLIEGARMSDGGFYKCFVRNKFGEDEKKFSVLMRDPTRIVLEPRDATVRTGEDAVFSCKAATDPAEVKNLRYIWLKDNVTLDITNPQLKRYAGELVISRVAFADSAEYTCVATNGLDEVTASATLRVQAPPGPPTKVTLLSCMAQKATLVWRFDTALDNFSPLKSFSIEYSTAYDEDFWEKMQTVPARKRKVAVNLSCYANYTFRIRAVNEVGPGTPSIPTHTTCMTPSCVPDHHPRNVKTVGDITGYLVVEWEFMRKIEHNGPDFRYIVMVSKEGESTVESFIISDYFEDRFEMLVEDVYQPYRVTVKAANALGEPPEPAESVLGYSGEGVPTVAPDNFTLTDDSRLVEGETTFEWYGVDGDPELMQGKFQGYKIRYWNAGDPDGIVRETIVPKEAAMGPRVTATVRNLPMYSDLSAEVAAMNTYYTSVGSNVVNFSTPEGVPDPPAFVVVKYAGAIHFLVEWAEPEVINGLLTGYRVGYREITDEGLEDMVIVTDTTRERTSIGELKPDTEYRIFVWALTKVGQGDPFYVDARTARKDTAIAMPEVLNIHTTDRTIEVEWVLEDSPDFRAAAYYYLEYRQLGTSRWRRVSQVETTWFVQTVGRLNPQSTYEIRVVAQDSRKDRTESLTQIVNTEERISDDDMDDYTYASGNGTNDDEDMVTEESESATHNVVFLTGAPQQEAFVTTTSTTEREASTTEGTIAVVDASTRDDVNRSTTVGVPVEEADVVTWMTTTTTTTTGPRVVDIGGGNGTTDESGVVLPGKPDVTGSESGDIIYVVVKNGEPLDLICRVEGSRPARVKWSKDEGGVIRESENTLMVNHHRLADSRLVILKPQDSDAGMYKCAINNDSKNSGKGQFFQVALKNDIRKESCAVVGNTSSPVHPGYSICVVCLVFRFLTTLVGS